MTFAFSSIFSTIYQKADNSRMIWLAIFVVCIVGVWLLYVTLCIGAKIVGALFLIIIHKIRVNLRKMSMV